MMSRPDLRETSRPTRREFVALGVGALVAAGLPAAFRARDRLVRRTVPVMGTIADILVVHGDPRQAQSAVDEAIRQLRGVEAAMTRFDSRSEVGQANVHALYRAVPVSAATALVLREALLWAEASDGTFDPGLGKAVVLWDVGRRRTPPPAESVRRLAGRRLYRALELEGESDAGTVRFHDPDLSIDLGGIAKGYGVDRAVAALRARGIRNGLVNVGGDLYALGTSEDGDPWKVGIRDPDDPDAIVASVHASDAAVATSGDYIQYFQHAGRRYHHMLDPRSGEPKLTTVRTLTVMASTCMAADAAGTAIFGMPSVQARKVLESRDPAIRIVHRA